MGTPPTQRTLTGQRRNKKKKLLVPLDLLLSFLYVIIHPVDQLESSALTNFFVLKKKINFILILFPFKAIGPTLTFYNNLVYFPYFDPSSDIVEGLLGYKELFTMIHVTLRENNDGM